MSPALSAARAEVSGRVRAFACWFRRLAETNLAGWAVPESLGEELRDDDGVVVASTLGACAPRRCGREYKRGVLENTLRRDRWQALGDLLPKWSKVILTGTKAGPVAAGASRPVVEINGSNSDTRRLARRDYLILVCNQRCHHA